MTQEKPAMRKKQSPSWRPDFVQEHLDRWKKSRLSLPKYCQQQGIAYDRLAWWRNKLMGPVKAQRSPMPATLPSSFVQVDVVSAKNTEKQEHECGDESAGIEVKIPGGCRLVVQQNFHAETLKRLIHTLGATC